MSEPRSRVAAGRPGTAQDGDRSPIWSRLVGARRGRPALDYQVIYRYLASKEDLLDLMLDAAFGEIALPERPSGDWRADLARLARATRQVLKKHPWAGALMTSRPTLGPGYLRWFEFSLAALAARGVGVRTAVRVVGTVYAYVSGVVAYELGEAEANRRHGLSEARKRAPVAPYLETLLASGRYPNLARIVRQGSEPPGDASFEFGLRSVLAGLEQVLPGRAGRQRGAARR